MIIDAYCRIRTIDQTIPDDVLDFMKYCAIESLENTSKVTMKTKIECLNEASAKAGYIDWIHANFRLDSILITPIVESAMEEYASQFKAGEDDEEKPYSLPPNEVYRPGKL